MKNGYFLILIIALFLIGNTKTQLTNSNCFSSNFNGICIISQESSGGFYNQYRANSLENQPTLSQSAFVNLINSLGTPVSSEGGFALCAYNEAIRYGVDPLYMLAFARKETGIGTAGIGQTSEDKNLFGMTVGTKGDPTIDDNIASDGKFKVYTSYCQSVTDWDAYIRNYYFSKSLFTPNQIIPIYAPTSDGNNVEQYISDVNNFVNQYRQMS